MTHATADLFDADETIASCETQFRSFGKPRFSGSIRTIRCDRDNALLKETLNMPGAGAVMVVDGGGSLGSALVGDLIAGSAVKNGWAGLVVYGAIRDSVALDSLDIGVKALGTNPRKSAKTGAGELDQPVSFGGVSFVPGHMLYSDEDGIVTRASAFEA
jgi:regulator of ribonuclease activity A